MWNQRYSEDGFAYGKDPNDFLEAEMARLPAGGRILCLAEGEGRNAVFLASQGFRVTAIDQSDVGLAKASELAEERGVTIETIVADLNEFDPGESQWDGIVSISAHLPSDIRADLHSRIVHALKPGGVFLLEAYTEQHLDMPGIGGPPPDQRDMFMSANALQKELTGMEFVHVLETVRHMEEGRYHIGESAVVQVIARKGAN